MADRNPFDTFLDLEKCLRGKCLVAIEKAEELSGRIIDAETAKAETCWGVIWPKPLYAGTRVATGGRSEKKIGPKMRGAWRTWGSSSASDDCIADCGHGYRPRFTCCVPDGIVETARNPELGPLIAMHRLFAIQGAARALRARARAGKHPFKDLVDPIETANEVNKLRDVVRELKDELGFGWGPISVLHVLTDMGLAVKPDVWLVRTFSHLYQRDDLPAKGTVSIARAAEINLIVRKPLDELPDCYWEDLNIPFQDSDSSRIKRRRRLRFLDKTLMEISRCGLLPDG